MTLIEKLFCTAGCKKLNQKTRSRLILKFFIMVGLAVVMACGLTSNILFLILSITSKNLSIGATIPLFVIYVYLFLLVCNHYIFTAMRDPGSIDPASTVSSVIVQRAKLSNHTGLIIVRNVSDVISKWIITALGCRIV